MLEPLVEQSFSQPFAQVLHNAVTLSNKFKYYSVAIQFVDDEWLSNHVVAISFGQIVSAKAESVTPQIKNAIKNATGYVWELITAMSNQDLAASGVTKALDLEVEACTMQ